MTDRTLSPQSVVVPLEDWRHVIGALKNAKARLPMGAAIGNVSDALSKVEHLQAAPAPSSLAGGEVTNDQIQSVMLAAIKEVRATVTDATEGACMDADIIRMESGLVDMGGTGWAVMRAVHRRLAALSPEAPARAGVDQAIYLKLIDTLKPFAEVAEKLKHCHVVEICEPTPDNPSRNIIPMPREWFERAADDLEAIAIQLHSDGVLSEGQTAKLTGLDRVEVRKQADALTPRHEAPASPTERELELLDAVMCAGGIVKTAAALPDKAAHLSLLTDALNRADAILTEGLNGAPVSHEAPACDDCGSPLNSDGECTRDLAEREADDRHGAPAEGAGERDTAADALRELRGLFDANGNLFCSGDHQLEVIARADAALRARSSAPEAREEALGNLLAVIHGDGGHRALEVGTKQAALEAEKIVAGLLAAPSADKLRIAVEALEPFRKVHDVVRSKPGAYILTGAAGITVSDVRRADQALAVLKAEGAK